MLIENFNSCQKDFDSSDSILTDFDSTFNVFTVIFPNFVGLF